MRIWYSKQVRNYLSMTNNKIDLEDLREELFTDYIQNYDHLSNDEISEMVDKEINKIKNKL